MLPIVVALLLPPKRGCLVSPWNKFWSVASGKAPIPLYASTTRILCDSLTLQLSSLQIPSLCLRWLGTTFYLNNFLSFSGNCVLPWIMEITLCTYFYIRYNLKCLYCFNCVTCVFSLNYHGESPQPCALKISSTFWLNRRSEL